MDHHSIMKLHFLTLKYCGESSNLEASFQKENFRVSLPINRAALMVGILFYTLFGILDALLIPEYKSTMWLIRFAIVDPIIIGIFLLSFSKSFERYVNPLMTFGSILAGGGIICMIIIAPPPVNYSYYAGILLVFIWTYTFVRIPFLWASLSGWVLVVLYEIAAIWISQTPLAIMINNNFFFISANILGMIACYSMEYYTRRDFFLMQQIEMGRENINRVNWELEQEIDERRKAQETLRESEERFRAFVEHSSDIIALINLDGIITYINPAVETVLGFKPEERIGARGFELVHPDDIKPLADSFMTLSTDTNAPIIKGEMRLRHKNGSWRTVEAQGSNLVYNHVVQAIIINYRDITERKHAEEALKQSENKYRLSFENVSDIILIMDNDLKVSSISPSIERILGYKPRDFIDRSIFDMKDLLTPESFQKALSNIDLILKGEIVSADTYDFAAKDGTIKFFELSGSPLMQEGKIIGAISIARDVTDKKRVEDALRENEERYRALVENANDMVFRTDTRGYFTFANAAMICMFGCEEQEIIGKNYLSIIHPNMRKDAAEFFNNQFTKKISNTYSEYLVKKKDGNEFWVGQNTQLIIEDGKIIGTQAVSRDITERKRLEKELRESEERYRELSIIDGLTQLYNARYFYAQLEKEIERSNRYKQPLTLLLLDLDKFKDYNDTYGHVEGDHVLSRLGQLVKRCLRESDSAYRYGGEEFTIMLPMTTSEEGMIMAQRIRTELRKEAFAPVFDKEIYMTLSIGVAQYKPKEEMTAFVQRTDQLMYQAKRNGRDRICPES